MKNIYVGMSGGVDSSVSAALLKEQGYNVTGVFMKNWARDLPGFKCPWREDLADAKRVAVQLNIPFKVYDFQKEYKQSVVDYMIAQYKAGQTPNPDIMCNQEVKFKLFLKTAIEDGADMIATGHYAKSKNAVLGMAHDQNKDQTYFLYRITKEALEKTIFPLGSIQKSVVREKAKKIGLITANKKDSVGICFVGEIGIKEFLQNFATTEPGSIIEKSTKNVLGQHEGALYYTIGQRHGLSIGGGLPYYVIGKDMAKNEVYVSTDLNDPDLWHSCLVMTNVHWINSSPTDLSEFTVRVRHRGPLISVTSMQKLENGDLKVTLKDEIRALAPGQSAVLYQNNICLGGGIII